ncbi:MAG: signal peptidase II [Acidobacteria bacterium]|nr:signal peptidase II [Acidobacteriota bacterium]MCB9397431.1 signal peptidase II [Acidobacteriota bacterium]
MAKLRPILLLGLVSIDQLLKLWASHIVGGSLALTPWLRIWYVRNDRGWLAFLNPSFRPSLMLLFSLSVLVLSYVLFKRAGRSLPLAGVLIWAGTLGNALDWLFFAYVRDFIQLPGMPVFNLADTYLIAGLLSAILYWIRSEST